MHRTGKAGARVRVGLTPAERVRGVWSSRPSFSDPELQGLGAGDGPPPGARSSCYNVYLLLSVMRLFVIFPQIREGFTDRRKQRQENTRQVT